MISADIKTDAKQEIKKLVPVSYNFSLSIKNKEFEWGRRVRRFLINDQNLLVWPKLSVDPLMGGSFHLSLKFISKSYSPLQRRKNLM